MSLQRLNFGDVVLQSGRLINFYESRNWRELRYQTLLKYGRKCMCCGLKSPDAQYHVDHIIPRSIRPDLSLDPKNLQVLCSECNLGKGAHDQTDWRVKNLEEFFISENSKEQST